MESFMVTRTEEERVLYAFSDFGKVGKKLRSVCFFVFFPVREVWFFFRVRATDGSYGF